MNIEQILATLNSEIVERLKTAVEIGKWPNGVALTDAQRQTCLQAVLIWEHEHVPEQQRTGYIDRGSKQQDEHCDDSAEQQGFSPLKFH